MIIKTTQSKILYGADPESFAGYISNGKLYALPPYFFRKIRDVEIVEEDERHPVFIETDEYKVHEDGSAFEFSLRPAFDPIELFDRIQEAARATSEKILKMFPDDCLPELQFTPTIGWDIERWKDMPQDFFMSTLFGCDPSKDVFNLTKRAKEVDASKHGWRYAGGHLHFSGSPAIAEDPHQAVRCQVITSGLAATFYSPHPNLERDRTFLYGIPGNYRDQNYGRKNPFGEAYRKGFEYRTLSATWAGNRDVAMKVLEWGKHGIYLLESGLGEELVPKIVEPTIEAIMNADQRLAGELLSFVESRL